MEKSIREFLEERERKILSPKAAFSSESKGRKKPEELCSIRPEYQRDRDRIIHSKAFRRLKHKTQVFLSPTGDHYRTRLTHTLEVSQIARTISKALCLNEDLTEAISLGHDLGHTPFGHAGEEALRELLPGGFNHYEQSLRVVDFLEQNGRGLNLTYEVRDGIHKHSKGFGEIFVEKDAPETLEGNVVRASDLIAYVNHDVDDSIRGGIIRASDIPQEAIKILGNTHAKRINTMVMDVIKNSVENGMERICMSDEIFNATQKLRDFLYEAVYFNDKSKAEFKKTKKIINDLFYYIIEHPEKGVETFPESDSLEIRVGDFIAGMTDRYALRMYEELFLPKPWMIV